MSDVRGQKADWAREECSQDGPGGAGPVLCHLTSVLWRSSMPIPFGEWAPDAYGVNADFAGEAAGVLPRALSYGPWPQLAETSLAVPAPVRGAFAARTAGNAVAIY